MDRRHAARECCLQGDDLRAVPGKGGAGAVDKLVRNHRPQLSEWYDALDHSLESVVQAAPDLPEWAVSVAKGELLDWHRTREYLTSAVLDYHHGDTGSRPETVFGNLRYHFSAGASVELVPGL
ncbi:hypothetical protein GCM10011583_72620 [Streptomyces camponoticapitis]|uniref:Uncharacterized protein n=1 Tax=Streptomyces camponoticapitis TaxID=1616125 RepID=A0ABQ2F0P6_9ACTN|nr:hypothetical protein [Streptomyces camponoticapitis]GGK30212.1 hypothetical protein GCM10011583_72620 [Streptomyces camponoticapitis]